MWRPGHDPSAVLLYFGRTLAGKALRATAVNRVGAQIVGIGITQAGRASFLLAAAMGAVCGILIAPFTTIYYDSGFLIGLKGFVAAIIGGLASYPVAAAGSLLVGLLESYASFWASAYKEVIVFTLILPVLLWEPLAAPHHDEGGRRMNRYFCSSGGHGPLPVLPTPEFWITQANHIGLFSIVALGLVLLTGVGGMTSFGPSRLCRARGLCHVVPEHGLGHLPGWACLRVGCEPACSPGAGRADHAPVGPLPAAGHHCLGLPFFYLFGNLEWLGKSMASAALRRWNCWGARCVARRKSTT